MVTVPMGPGALPRSSPWLLGSCCGRASLEGDAELFWESSREARRRNGFSLSLGGCFRLRSRSGSVAVLQSGGTEQGCGCVGPPVTPWSPPSPSPRPRCPLLGPLFQLPLPHPPTPSCAPAPSGSSPATKRRDPMENPQIPGCPPHFWGAEGNISAFFLHLLQLEQPGSHTRRKKEAGTPPAPVAERKARPSCGVPMAHRGLPAEDRAGGAAGRARGCPGPPRSCPNGVSAG